MGQDSDSWVKRLPWVKAGREKKEYRDWSGMTLERAESQFVELGSWQVVADRLECNLQSLINFVTRQRKLIGRPCKKMFDWSDISADEAEGLFESLGSWKAVADHYGVHLANLKNHIARHRKRAKDSN